VILEWDQEQPPFGADYQVESAVGEFLLGSRPSG
jgi:hypothetical protein